jgi:hypothetical protein
MLHIFECPDRHPDKEYNQHERDQPPSATWKFHWIRTLVLENTTSIFADLGRDCKFNLAYSFCLRCGRICNPFGAPSKKRKSLQNPRNPVVAIPSNRCIPQLSCMPHLRASFQGKTTLAE